jgi:predicted anti-sigma-YlaC factor YlaD
MSQCRRFQELIESLLAEEISSSDGAELDEHCAVCEACAGLVKLHRDLLAVDAETAMPDKHDFREMRESVLAATA